MDKRAIVLIGLVFAFWLLAGGAELLAQCPMCKMAAESNLQDGGTAGRGLNKGILWMFFTPYLVVAAIGYFWYRNRPRDEAERAPDQAR